MALNPGDIGFVQYNADGTDDIAFVALVDIAAGEEIRFTDNGWLGDNSGFRPNEGVITWTAPASGIAAGTVVTLTTAPSASAGTVSETADLNFSGSGDQIIAYQDNGTITPIAALNNDGAGIFQADATSSNTSALPQGLMLGTSAVALTEIDNAVYTGPTTGDRATLQAALFDAANWTGSDTINQTFSGTFTVSGGAPAPTLISEIRPNPPGSDPAQQTLELSGEPDAAFSGVLLSLESDTANSAQVVDRVSPVTGTFDANGILSVSIDDLENPSFTLILVDSFSGSVGDTIYPTSPSLGTVLDAVGVPDNATDAVQGAAFGGVDLAYIGSEPELIFRDGTTGDWYQVDFNGVVYDAAANVVDPAGFDVDPSTGDTFGAVNPSFNATPGVTVSQLDGNPSIEATEGGATDIFTISFNTVPSDPVGVLVTPDAQTDLGNGPGNFVYQISPAGQPVTVFVSAVDDADIEGPHTSTISIVLDSLDPDYNALPVPDVTVNITDNDAATPVTTLISAIQGTTDTSPLVGQTVTVEAIVVGDFQDGDADTSRDLRGFYIQEEDTDADGDAATSEGLFVFEGTGNFITDVNVGDRVLVTGTVNEFFGQTQLVATSVAVVDTNNTAPTAAVIDLSASTATTLSQDGDYQPDLEAYESMLVTFSDTLTITEQFQLDRFNEIKLFQGDVAGDRPAQFTQNNAPDAAAYDAYLQEIGARTITYDDGLNFQNQPIDNLDGFAPYSSATAPRMGDTVTNLEGVLDYQWAGNSASGATWRVRSVEDGSNVFDEANPRPAETAPDVGGTMRVASFNVLNFFTTLDMFPNVGEGSGPNGLDPRGADANPQAASPTPGETDEYDRQLQKLTEALLGLDSDVIGLVELENDFLTGGVGPTGTGTVIGSGVAIEEIVDALNAALGTPGRYDYVRPVDEFGNPVEFIGTDAIAVGFIYDTTTVGLTGDAAILDDSGFTDPNSSGLDRNRPALAQTFTELATGESFTAVINHLKSKGASGLTAGDALNPDSDQLDGAGFWNDTRTDAVNYLVNWLSTDPTGSGDPDFLILGDLNAYAQETPITALQSAGYTNLAAHFGGDEVYSYVFDGQTGTLDYALAGASLLPQITGAVEWHINADEADALDYNLDFGRNAGVFSGTDPFRASDHDPIILGLSLLSAPPVGPTPNTDDLVGDAGDNTVVFTSATLTDGDRYDGLDGNDTVELSGGGTFDFTGVTLENVEAIRATSTDPSSVIAFETVDQVRLLTEAAGANDEVRITGNSGGALNPDFLFGLADAGVETTTFATSVADVSVTLVDQGDADPSNDRIRIEFTDQPGGVEKHYISLVQEFDRSGTIRRVETVHDDGRESVAIYDETGVLTATTFSDGPANAANYETVSVSYTNGVRSQSTVVLDNEVTSVTDYAADGVTRTQTVSTDNSADGSAVNYETRTTTYNPDGSLASRVTVYDAGERYASTDFQYDVDGAPLSQTFTFADGSARENVFAGGVIDRVVATAADGSLTLYGLGGDDDLLGAASNDSLFGGDGNDTLNGGEGDDLLVGQADNDLFVFSGIVGNDTISDFDLAGDDVLDLTAFGVMGLDDLTTAGAITEAGRSVVIDLAAVDAAYSGTITLSRVTLADIAADDFISIG